MTIEKNPMISVIIPVYNVGRFVRKCLQSLEDQTYQDFEIIAVNDGSTDDSLSILREFERKYGNITVVDQKNKGMSMARNEGLRRARSKYVCFVDSDDYVAPQYLEKLYRACVDNDAQISYCYYTYHYIKSDLFIGYPFRCCGVFNQEEAMKRLLHDTEVQSLTWNKLYERRLFSDYDITFPKMCFEDMATANKLFSHVERVAVIDESLYFYNQHDSSTLATMNAAKINDFVRSMGMVRISLEQSGNFSKYKKSYKALLRKTGTCCFSYVYKLHSRKHSMRGCLANIRRIVRAMRHFAADEFSPTFSSFPDVVCEPQEKKKLEKDYSLR